ncbi:hypothetical protein KKC97_12105 [bacterium]|nr:hypothetical protein [bacterium]
MKKYKFFLYYLTVTALLFWSFGCDEDDPVETPPPTGLEILEVPLTLLANIDSIYTIRVRVADEGVDPDYVLCTVSGPSGSNPGTFNLYDDGSLNELEAHPYAQSPSGDIVPNNDTYTRDVNSRLLTNEIAGEYTFSFSVPGQSDPIYTKSETVLAADIEDCILTHITEINGLIGCFDPVDLTPLIEVTEPDSVIDVYGVLLLDGVSIDTLNFISEEVFPALDTPYWISTILPNSFPCAGTDDNYSLRYEVSTRFGMNCSATTADFSILNDDQTILNFRGLPDTLYRPTAVGDTDTVAVTLDLEDCNLEGIQTFNGVRFDVKRDTIDWYHEDKYRLNDEGVSGDSIAGDGTYSVGLTFNRSDTYLDNLYIFRYYSVDCAPPYEQTDYLYDTVRVIQPLAEADGLIPASDELGFEVITAPARENHL